MTSKAIPPAPKLFGQNHDLCSDCHVPFVWAGDENYKVCPKCYAVLWHTNWAYHEQVARERKRAEEKRAAAKRAADREVADKRAAEIRLAEIMKQRDEEQK